ncbi:hypothetical protein LCGC14_2050700 [marine sediment metagenome]|uniref:Uncharacterized protein n=1 Tax=marine sediment metagenome TaxID=412755 RepID=A0A0F9EP97_9ZZZZ
MNHATTGQDKHRSYNGDYMETGKTGEKVVIDWLQSRPNILGVTDFRDIRRIHEADVDVGVRLYTGQVCLAEIKTDTYLGCSGNILNEVLRINHYAPHEHAGYLGWTLRSPARWLLYYAPNKVPKAIYKAEFSQVRLVLQRFTREMRKKLKFQITATDAGKTTYNILIPESEYEGVFSIIELD